MEIKVRHQWDGTAIDHDPVEMKFIPEENGLRVGVSAPFFDDPAPSGIPGEPLWLLWEYEVVEAFFLNSNTGEYLEVEFGPHGHHLVLIFKEWRKPWRKCLDLTYSSKISSLKWEGTAKIPWDYFPVNTNKFNAYAIHGCDEKRVYEALYPSPKNQYKEPDFHRLDYFEKVDDVIALHSQKVSEKSVWENLD